MTHRERELATIRHQLPDRIPVDAICIENVPALAAQLGIPEAAVLEHLGLDGRLVGLGYAGETEAGLSEWSTTANDDYGTTHRYPLAGAESTADIMRHPWPDPRHYHYAAAAAAAGAWHPEYAVRGPYWHPLFCRVCSLAGMEEALMWMLSDPVLFEATLEQVFERTFSLCRRYIRHLGDHLDIFCFGDDFASQRGLLMAPELWRHWLKPRYAKLFALARAAGKPVWFHSCGDITAVLPDLIDIGVEVWETVQLHTLPLSPEALKREYGRHLTFFGAVSTQQLPFQSADEVAATTTRCVEALGEGGGYICGPDHHIKPDVPVANTLALFDTARQFSRPGYTAL